MFIETLLKTISALKPHIIYFGKLRFETRNVDGVSMYLKTLVVK